MISNLEIEEIMSFFKIKALSKSTKCNGDVILIRKISSLFYVRCKWRFCKHEQNIFEATPLKNFKFETKKAFDILKLWFEDYKIKQISQLLNISKKAILKLIKKCSAIGLNNYYNNIEKIGGSNVIVEVDESKFGKRKY